MCLNRRAMASVGDSPTGKNDCPLRSTASRSATFLGIDLSCTPAMHSTLERRVATETRFAPATARIRSSRAGSREQSALQRLTSAATERVDELIQALERLPGRPYLHELVAVAASLHNRDVEGALQAWHAIPWSFDNERGYGGLALCEARDARVKTAARALDTALARLKVCFRYGRIPEPLASPRPVKEPLLF